MGALVWVVNSDGGVLLRAAAAVRLVIWKMALDCAGVRPGAAGGTTAGDPEIMADGVGLAVDVEWLEVLKEFALAAAQPATPPATITIASQSHGISLLGGTGAVGAAGATGPAVAAGDWLSFFFFFAMRSLSENGARDAIRFSP